MRCSKCGFDNPDGMKFCGQCTTSLALVCPKCGFENPSGFRFCGQCTTALGSGSAKPPSSNPISIPEADSPAALDGERKTVTALFADIKGSTELMEDLDPEQARAIIDPALKLMIEAVRRYDGYVVQSTGDGIFALFGAPVAHEDHPQRALYAALRLPVNLLWNLGFQTSCCKLTTLLGHRLSTVVRFRDNLATNQSGSIYAADARGESNKSGRRTLKVRLRLLTARRNSEPF